MNIVKIEEHDIDRIAEVFTIAFEEDPIFKYIFRDAGKYKIAAPWLFASWIKWAVRFGEAWMSEDKSAAVITRKQGDARMSFASMVRAGMLPTPFKLGLRAFYRFYFKILPVLDKNHKTITGNTPHWYGWMIGTTIPGKGMGRPLLNYVRDIADEKQLPIFLETATPSNLSLYELFGFEIKGRQTVDKDCTVYFLMRPPQIQKT